MTYCPTQKSCCQKTNEFTAELCNEETSFCGTTTVCPENVSSSDVNNPVPLFSTYTPIYTSTLKVAVGYNLIILPPDERFEYFPGDVLAWIKSSSSATLVVASNRGKYSVLESVTSVPNGNITLSPDQRQNNQTGTVLLAGIASKPSEFMTNISAPNSPGVKTITLTHNTSEENYALTRLVTALYPVGNISFTLASNSCIIYGISNEAFNISIKFLAGTDAKVKWSLHNITVISSPYLTIGNRDETNWQQDFTLSTIGEYPLVVMVTNGVSGKVLTATVVIQEKITGVNATKADSKKTAYQGFSTKLNVSILTGTDVTYKWYFGDGSDVVTVTNATVDHFYQKHGQINTTVEATNMVSSVNYSFIIDIINPVEITVPPYAVANVSTNITCKLTANLLSAYVVVLQVNNESMTSSNCNTIQHVFAPGDHDIHCYIHTVVVLYSNESLFAVEPIAGLSILHIPPQELGANYTTEANISTGNNVSYEWKIQGETFHGNPTGIGFNKVGWNKVILIAFNAISNVSAEKLVIVQERIGDLNITPLANPAKTNAKITFNIIPTTKTGAINYTANITAISAGAISYTANVTAYSFDGQPSSQFSHTFTSEGIYAIFIFATNLIISANASYIITVQVPVRNPPEITCPSVSLEDLTCVISTEVQWSFKAEIPYATNVTFEWIFGEKAPANDSSPSKQEFNLISTSNELFAESKIFNITVKAKNRVSERIKTLRVESLHNVSEFSFECPRAVAVNASFEIVAKIAKGSNVTYSYVFGDGRGEIRVASTKVIWNYSTVGVYQIKGNASNLVSSLPFSCKILVRQEIIDVSIYNVKTVETNKEATVTWQVTGGTNVTSFLTFENKRSKAINYTECNEKHSTMTCTTTYQWSKSGTYEIRIQAENLLETKKTDTVNVTVQDRIEKLSVKVDPKFESDSESDEYYVNEEIPVIVNVAKGSHVKYQVDQSDGSPVFNTSERKFNLTYFKLGEHTPSIKAFNDVSNVENTNLILKIQQRPEPVPIKDLKLSAKATRYNEKTKFEVEYGEGAIFECKLNFGDGSEIMPIKEENLKQGASHQYNTTGSFNAKLTCWNEGPRNKVYDQTEVFVHEHIEGFEVTTSTLVGVYEKAGVELEFIWQHGSHMNVIAYAKNSQKFVSKANLNYDSREGKILLPTIFFPSPDQYIIRVNASNKVSSLDKPEEVIINIIERIENAKLLFNEWVSVSYPVRAYLTVDKGSDMVVTWNFGDGTPTSTTNCTWKQSCFHDHTYRRKGQYLISAAADNALGQAKAGEVIVIQYGIIGWKFRQVGVGRTGEPSKVELVHNSTYKFPTDAEYKITFDKDVVKSKTLINNSQPVIEEHTYKKAGCYAVKAIMENKVSKVLLETTIKVQGTYGKAHIYAKSLKGELNASQSVFPLEYPVKFESNIENDCLKYNWTITAAGGKILTVNHFMSFQYTFNMSGTYTVKCIAYDSEDVKDKITAEKVVKVDKSVTGLFLSSEGVGKVNESVWFILVWASLGDSTNFTAVYDDGKSEELSLTKKVTNFAQYDGKLSFDPAGLEGLIFSHNFSKIAQFKVTVKVSDGKKRETLVTISEQPCPLPAITVTGGNKDANRAPQVPYETDYTIFSKVRWIDQSRCSDIKIDFEWRIFEADEYLLKTTGLSVIPPQKDKEIK